MISLVNKEHTITLKTLIMIFAFSLYSVSSILITWTQLSTDYPASMTVYKSIEYFVMIILMLAFISFKPTMRECIYFFISVVIGLASLVKLHDYRFIMFVLFAFASKNVEYKKVMLVALIFNTITISLVLILNRMGILVDKTMGRVGSDVVRHSLGFAHPNFLGAAFLLLTLQFFWVRGFRVSVFELLLIVLGSLAIGNVSDSRSSEALSVLACGVMLIARFTDSGLRYQILKQRLFRAVVLSVPWILAAASLVIMAILRPGTKIYDLLSKILSSRLEIFQFYFSINGWHLFPRQITQLYQQSTFVGMDNTFVYLIVSFGIVALMIFAVISSLTLRNLIKNNDLASVIVMVIILFWGLVESIPIFPFVGFFVLAGFNSTIERVNYVENSITD